MKQSEITAFIIDDELKARQVLAKLLKQHCPDVQLLGSAANAKAARQKLQELQVDMVFLDIHLGEENSFDLLDKLELNTTRIVFTTGHSEYALRAFGYQAAHYLLKPIDVAGLKEAVARVQALKSTNKPAKPGEVKKQAQPTNRIALPDLYGYELVEMADIIRLEGKGAYTLVIIKGSNEKMISKPLGHFEEQLTQSHFFRIHKKHLINIKELVKCTREKTPVVTLSNGDQLSVSWRLRASFFEYLKQTTSF